MIKRELAGLEKIPPELKRSLDIARVSNLLSYGPCALVGEPRDTSNFLADIMIDSGSNPPIYPLAQVDCTSLNNPDAIVKEIVGKISGNLLKLSGSSETRRAVSETINLYGIDEKAKTPGRFAKFVDGIQPYLTNDATAIVALANLNLGPDEIKALMTTLEPLYDYDLGIDVVYPTTLLTTSRSSYQPNGFNTDLYTGYSADRYITVDHYKPPATKPEKTTLSAAWQRVVKAFKSMRAQPKEASPRITKESNRSLDLGHFALNLGHFPISIVGNPRETARFVRDGLLEAGVTPLATINLSENQYSIPYLYSTIGKTIHENSMTFVGSQAEGNANSLAYNHYLKNIDSLGYQAALGSYIKDLEELLPKDKKHVILLENLDDLYKHGIPPDNLLLLIQSRYNSRKNHSFDGLGEISFVTTSTTHPNNLMTRGKRDFVVTRTINV